MAHFDLTLAETRILGALLEKERLVPESYPLSVNYLATACNQSTNREPVMSLSEQEIETGLTALREKRLATMIHSSGSRVPKYRHNLPDHYELAPREVALLCVLMLRGPQTPGELRQRTERMAAFPSVEEVESALRGLMAGDEPLVRLLPPRPGQKESRYVQLLSGEPVEPPASGDPLHAAPARASRTEALEAEVAALREELRQLREEFAGFKKQFE